MYTSNTEAISFHEKNTTTYTQTCFQVCKHCVYVPDVHRLIEILQYIADYNLPLWAAVLGITLLPPDFTDSMKASVSVGKYKN